MVHIDSAGMGVRRIRLANLAPELKDHTIRAALSPYGEVKEVLEDTWTKANRCKVYNGVRIAVTNLNPLAPQFFF